MNALALVVAASLTAAAASQSIQFSATTTAPIALLASSPTVSDTQSLTLSQQPQTTHASAQAGSAGSIATARALWSTNTDSDMSKGCNYTIHNQVLNSSSATIPQHELVIELTATAPRPVKVTYSFNSASNSGPIQFEVDMGDTGSFSSVARSLSLNMTLSPQPYRIRIRAQAHTPGPANPFPIPFTAHGWFDLNVTPENDLTLTKVVQGCGTEAVVGQVFTSSGIGLRAPNTPQLFNRPVVAVLGLAAQPFALPNLSTSQFPCLLYPRPDVVIAFVPTPIASRSTSSAYSLPIPATVRPFGFFVQVVKIASATDLRTSDGYFVNAF